MKKKNEEQTKKVLRKNLKGYATAMRVATAVASVMMLAAAVLIVVALALKKGPLFLIVGIVLFGASTVVVMAVSGRTQNVRPFTLFLKGIHEKDVWLLSEWTEAEQQKILETFHMLRESGNLNDYRLTEGKIVKVKLVAEKDGSFLCANCGGSVGKNGVCEHCETKYE